MNIEIKDSERNVYLKQFYDGILYGPLESNVEKSRPWIKYYTVEELANPIVYRTMYEDLIYYTQNNLDCESSTYLGNHVTYKDFIENINITASVSNLSVISVIVVKPHNNSNNLVTQIVLIL